MGRIWNRYDRVVGWLVSASNLISALCVLILAALVTADIFGRYMLNDPVPMTYEIGSFLMVFVVFMGLAYTQRKAAHIRVELFLPLFPDRVRAGLDLIALSLGFLLYAAIAYQSFRWAWTSWQVGDYVAGLVRIPSWPAQFAVPLGSALLCLQYIADIAQRLESAPTANTENAAGQEER